MRIWILIWGLIKAFIGKPSFSAANEDDLDNILNIVYILSDICAVMAE